MFHKSKELPPSFKREIRTTERTAGRATESSPVTPVHRETGTQRQAGSLSVTLLLLLGALLFLSFFLKDDMRFNFRDSLVAQAKILHFKIWNCFSNLVEKPEINHSIFTIG